MSGPDDKLDEGLAIMAAGVRAEERRFFWRHYWPRRVVPLIAVVGVIVSIVTGLVVANLYDRQTATEAVVTALRSQAEQSKTTGDKANAELAQRGQPQVPIPTPGTAPDTDVIVSAAAARVLASLPVSPTRSEISAQIAREIAAQPVPAPPISAIAAVIAGYFETNPVPAGPTGERGEQGKTGETGPKGEKGDSPTAEEIQADFAQYLTDHPEALCPRGGSIAQLRVQLADGGSADTWTCVVASYPPPTTSGLPIPTI